MADKEIKSNTSNNTGLSKTKYVDEVIRDIEKNCPNIRQIIDGCIPHYSSELNTCISNCSSILKEHQQSQVESVVNSLNNLSAIRTQNVFENPMHYDKLINAPAPIADIADATQENVQTSKEIKTALFVLIETVGEIKELVDVTRESNNRMETLNNRLEYLTKGMLVLAIGTGLFGFITVSIDLFSQYLNTIWINIVWFVALFIILGIMIYLWVILYNIHQINRQIRKPLRHTTQQLNNENKEE